MLEGAGAITEQYLKEMAALKPILEKHQLPTRDKQKQIDETLKQLAELEE